MENYPKRKRNRLENYDYSSEGAYFVTICIKDRRNVLSRVIVGRDAYIPPQVELSPYGKAAEEHLRKIPGMDTYVIMPNHIHFIAVRDERNIGNLSQDVKSFKTLVTKRIGESIWQSSFYDHIIRNEEDYLTKRKYIEENPAKWSEDELFNSGEMI